MKRSCESWLRAADAVPPAKPGWPVAIVLTIEGRTAGERITLTAAQAKGVIRALVGSDKPTKQSSDLAATLMRLLYQ